MPLTFSPEEMEILNNLLEQQELEVEQGYAMGDYMTLCCPWCGHGENNDYTDPCEFDEEQARAVFVHDPDCKLADTRALLQKIINWH